MHQKNSSETKKDRNFRKNHQYFVKTTVPRSIDLRVDETLVVLLLLRAVVVVDDRGHRPMRHLRDRLR